MLGLPWTIVPAVYAVDIVYVFQPAERLPLLPQPGHQQRGTRAGFPCGRMDLARGRASRSSASETFKYANYCVLEIY